MQSANADVLYSLPQDGGESQVYSLASGDVGIQRLGNEMQGVVNKIEVNGWSLGGVVDARIVLVCFSDAAYSMPCANATSTASEITNTGLGNNGSGGNGGFSGTAITPYTMVVGNYYKLHVTHSSGSGFKWGKRINTSGLPAAWVDQFSCVGCTDSGGTGHALSFRLNTISDGEISRLLPLDGSAFETLADAHFTGYYSRACGVSSYNYAHFLFSHSTGTTTSAYVPLSSCGLSAYDFQVGSTYLPYLGNYTYKVRLTNNAPPLVFNPTGTAFSASSTFSLITFGAGTTEFQFGQSQILGDSLLDGSILDNSVLVNEASGNATTTFYGQLQTGFAVVDVISTKFPFNWAIGFGQVLSDLDTMTSTTSLPEMEVDFGFLSTLQNISTTTGPVNWTVTFLSQDTFQDVADMTAVQLARTMCSYILWIALVFFAINEAYAVFSGGRSRVFQQNIEVQGDGHFKSWHRG